MSPAAIGHASGPAVLTNSSHAGAVGGFGGVGVAEVLMSGDDPASAGPREAAGDGGPRDREVFPNQLPETLAAEVDAAEAVGFEPISPNTRAFDAAVNEGTIKYVVLETGEVLVAPHTIEGIEISHAAIAGGRPVVAAGEADIAALGSRRIGVSISRQSGHYRPSEASLDVALDAFRHLGIEFAESAVDRGVTR